MAATSPSSTSEAEKQLLLAMGLPLKSWSANIPLGEFEGVTVDNLGLVVKIDLEAVQNKRRIKLKIDGFAQLKSLQGLNLMGWEKATGELSGPERVWLHGPLWGWVQIPLQINDTSGQHSTAE